MFNMNCPICLRAPRTLEEEIKELKINAQLAALVNCGLEQQVAQLRELLATKTNVCEMQHKLIRLLESQKETAE